MARVSAEDEFEGVQLMERETENLPEASTVLLGNSEGRPSEQTFVNP